jgi:hypothetical protein
MGFLGWLIVGVVTTHTYGFCIPLDFLGIKDLRKNKKRPRKFSKAIAKATDTFHRNFITFLPYLDRFDIRIQPIEAI